MYTKDQIAKINGLLQFREKSLLAKKTGLSYPTIINFFAGKENIIHETTQMKIVSAALSIVEERNKAKAAIDNKASILLN